EHGDYDKPIGQGGPQQGRHYSGEQDDQPAHGRRAPLSLMAGGPFRPDDLSYLPLPQTSDDRRSHHKSEQQSRNRRARGAKADVVEEIEDDVRLAERREPVIEHQSSAGM